MGLLINYQYFSFALPCLTNWFSQLDIDQQQFQDQQYKYLVRLSFHNNIQKLFYFFPVIFFHSYRLIDQYLSKAVSNYDSVGVRPNLDTRPLQN